MKAPHVTGWTRITEPALRFESRMNVPVLVYAHSTHSVPLPPL